MSTKVMVGVVAFQLALASASALGAAYFDSFESGIGNYWTRISVGPTGTLEITAVYAHSGTQGVLMDQVYPVDSHQQLQHVFGAPFRGTLSVWAYLPDLAHPPGPATEAAGQFQVIGPGGLSYDVEFIHGDVTGGWTSGQAHGGGVEIDYDKLWAFGPGWHELKLQVDATGARGWFDGVPMPHTHPGLTSCTLVNFGIGWNHGGAAVFDDYAAVPELGSTQVSKVALGFDHDGDGNYDLFLADPDGAHLVNLTPHSAYMERFPHISPDGTKICAHASPGAGVVLIYDLETHVAHYVTTDPPASRPVWRTDSELLYAANDGRQTWACGLDGSGSHLYIDWQLAAWPGPPAGISRLSSDGASLGGNAQDGYWAPSQDLFTVPAVAAPSSATLQWAWVDPSNDLGDIFCDFFPNGDILFTHNVQSYPEYHAVARSTPGSGVLTYLTPPNGFAFAMALSPDGTRVLYKKWDTGPYQGPAEFWVMNADGSDKRVWLPGQYTGSEQDADWGMVVLGPGSGDTNCDGLVDFGDINPFVLALSNPAQYQLFYPDCDIMNGDINNDGIVDFGDINPFVELLTQP